MFALGFPLRGCTNLGGQMFEEVLWRPAAERYRPDAPLLASEVRSVTCEAGGIAGAGCGP